MVQIETQNTNLADFSVSEIASAVKSILENQFAYIRVRGEISGYRGRHSSGHAYFGLKDQNARIDAVVWRASFSRLKVKPEDGLEVLATGRLSTFPGKSTYQLVVDWLEPAGVGALMALLEKRRRELAEEGLFDVSRKRPLPFLPRTIGVVTSPTGAVIRDILHRLADRFPTRVVVWPVRVQGEGSAEDLAAAIRGFGSVSLQKFVPRPDVLILARGGGSLEDLWSFNDETVVRAAAQSEIPIISAVGHETDWTLIDYVSDLRAPTPTAAAELCAPIRVEMLSRVEQVASRVLHATARQVLADKTRCRSALRALPPARFTLSAATQTLDSQTDAITATGRDYLRKRRLGLTQTAAMLERYSPNYQLVRWTERALSLRSKLNFFRDAVSSNAREKLKSAIDSFFFHMEWRAQLPRAACSGCAKMEHES